MVLITWTTLPHRALLVEVEVSGGLIQVPAIYPNGETLVVASNGRGCGLVVCIAIALQAILTITAIAIIHVTL